MTTITITLHSADIKNIDEDGMVYRFPHLFYRFSLGTPTELKDYPPISQFSIKARDVPFEGTVPAQEGGESILAPHMTWVAKQLRPNNWFEIVLASLSCENDQIRTLRHAYGGYLFSSAFQVDKGELKELIAPPIPEKERNRLELCLKISGLLHDLAMRCQFTLAEAAAFEQLKVLGKMALPILMREKGYTHLFAAPICSEETLGDLVKNGVSFDAMQPLMYIRNPHQPAPPAPASPTKQADVPMVDTGDKVTPQTFWRKLRSDAEFRHDVLCITGTIILIFLLVVLMILLRC